MNTHYGKALADRYLTNSFQHLLREAYKRILKNNPQYIYKPWAVDKREVIKTIKEIRAQESSDLKNPLDKNDVVAWIKSRRNQTDLLLISLSYVFGFVDVIPLFSANKIPIYTANTATGIAIANIPASGIVARNLLKKLKDKQSTEGGTESYNEQKVLSAAETYHRSLYWAMNAMTQSLLDSKYNFKEQSDRDVGHSNVRGSYGVIGGIICTAIKYQLESLFRSSRKEPNKGTDKRSQLTQRDLLKKLNRIKEECEDWYFDPNIRN